LRATGFDEAQVPLRQVGLQRQIELGKLSHATPGAQQVAEARQQGGRHGRHADSLAEIRVGGDYVRRNPCQLQPQK